MAAPQRPDFKAGLFSLGRLRPLLQREGVLLLRQLLPGATIAAWAERFAQGWEHTEARLIAGDMPERELVNFYRFGHPLPALIDGFGDWIDGLFNHLALRNLLRTLYGSEVCIIGSASLPRLQHPPSAAQAIERALPWHQDYEYVGPLQQAINVWIPLTPVGGDYPGLELWLGGPQAPLLEPGQPTAERDAILAAIPASELWRPQMQPGDVLIFTPYTVHRTHLDPGMSKTRISYELRLCPESDKANTVAQLHKRTL